MTYAFSKPPTEDQGDSEQQPRRNAFAYLAEGAKKKASASCLPEKKGIVGDAVVRGDWRLHNDLCDELKATGAGFQEKQVLTIGKRVLNILTDVRRTDAGTWPIAGTAAGTRRQHVHVMYEEPRSSRPSMSCTARSWSGRMLNAPLLSSHRTTLPGADTQRFAMCVATRVRWQ